MTTNPDRAGEQVLVATADVAREVFGDGLVAVFALGSLAHGGFAPLVSDVDIALVLDRVGGGTSTSVATVRERSIARSATSLAERLSIFWSDWRAVRDGPGPHCRLPAVDRLDLLDDGALLAGTDERSGARRPAKPELVGEGARFACTKFDDAYLRRLCRPDELVRDGPRAATKAALFPIRFLYTLATGRIGHNADAAEWYADHGAHPELARAAIAWRTEGIDGSAVVTLSDHLTGVHLEFFEYYADAMTADGTAQLGADLRDRARALTAMTIR